MPYLAVHSRTLRVEEGANDAMTMMSLRKVSRGHQLSNTAFLEEEDASLGLEEADVPQALEDEELPRVRQHPALFK